MNRQEVARQLAKCLAYLACGNLAEASRWANILVATLRDAGCDV